MPACVYDRGGQFQDERRLETMGDESVSVRGTFYDVVLLIINVVHSDVPSLERPSTFSETVIHMDDFKTALDSQPAILKP